jgi:hypothetical protein
VHKEARDLRSGPAVTPKDTVTPPAIDKEPVDRNATVTVKVPVAHDRGSNLVAYAAAVALAGVGAYFSVGGMAEIFPGLSIAMMAFAGTLEAAKLVTAGWLARNWKVTRRSLRAVLIALVAGLALINAAGVYGRLVEVHLGVTVAATSSVAERIGALDAKIDAQAKTVTGLDQRIEEIGAVIGKMTSTGRTKAALDAMASPAVASKASARRCSALRRTVIAVFSAGCRAAHAFAERGKLVSRWASKTFDRPPIFRAWTMTSPRFAAGLATCTAGTACARRSRSVMRWNGGWPKTFLSLIALM